MKKIPKLKQTNLAKVKAAYTQIKVAEKSLKDRVDYILNTIDTVFHATHDEWCGGDLYYYDAEDQYVINFKEIESKSKFLNLESSHFIENDEDNTIGLNIFLKETKSLSDKTAIDLSDGFPKAWLFEDFESELIVGRRKYRSWWRQKNYKKVSAAKRAKEAAAAKKETALAVIKSKLTAEEFTKLSNHIRGYYE